jgi:hypothetical protein
MVSISLLATFVVLLTNIHNNFAFTSFIRVSFNKHHIFGIQIPHKSNQLSSPLWRNSSPLFATMSSGISLDASMAKVSLESEQENDSISKEDQEISPAERLSRAIKFYSRAIPIFSSYKLLQAQLNFEREILNKEISEEEEQERWNKLHDWGSDVISETISELKGFYVKTGQIISTRVVMPLFQTIWPSNIYFLFHLGYISCSIYQQISKNAGCA